MVLSVLLHREVWCCPCCSIHKYGVVRVAPYIIMVLSVLLHREVWCCLCCSIEKHMVLSVLLHREAYGVVRVAP